MGGRSFFQKSFSLPLASPTHFKKHGKGGWMKVFARLLYVGSSRRRPLRVCSRRFFTAEILRGASQTRSHLPPCHPRAKRRISMGKALYSRDACSRMTRRGVVCCHRLLRGRILLSARLSSRGLFTVFLELSWAHTRHFFKKSCEIVYALEVKIL